MKSLKLLFFVSCLFLSLSMIQVEARMKLTLKELTVNFNQDQDLLESWRWKVGPTAEPFLITSLGDAFLLESDGSVFWLDVGGGEYNKVATSKDEFNQLLSNSDNINEWFIPQLVGDILEKGITLKEGQCFSFKKPPVLGGEYEIDNFEPTDVSVHFHMLGQIYEKVKDLPEGAPIGEIKFE